MEDLDIVRLTREVAGFPAGSVGTIVSIVGDWLMVDIGLYDTVDVPVDAVTMVRRFANMVPPVLATSH